MSLIETHYLRVQSTHSSPD